MQCCSVMKPELIAKYDFKVKQFYQNFPLAGIVWFDGLK